MKRQQLPVDRSRHRNNLFQGIRDVLVEKQPESSFEELRKKMKDLLIKVNREVGKPDLNIVYTRLTSHTRKNALHEEFMDFLRRLNNRYKKPYNEIINALNKYGSKNNNSGLTKFIIPFEELNVVVLVNIGVIKNKGKNVGQKGNGRDAKTLEVAGFILFLNKELEI